MRALLTRAVELSVLVYCVASMLSAGFQFPVRHILGPLRHGGAVLRALVANFVLVPLLGYLVVTLLRLDLPYAIGVMLVATAAGAPFLIRLTAAADADVGLATSLLVLLLPLTILYMPFVVPLLEPEAHVSAGAIARPLVLTLLAPLAIGLLAHAKASRWAARLQPPMARLSTVALVLLIACTLLANVRSLAGLLGERVILAVALLIAGAFVIGYGLGGAHHGGREVLGLGTAQRNISAASVAATQTFEDPGVIVTVVLAALVGFALLFPIARRLEARAALPGRPHGEPI